MNSNTDTSSWPISYTLDQPTFTTQSGNDDIVESITSASLTIDTSDLIWSTTYSWSDINNFFEPQLSPITIELKIASTRSDNDNAEETFSLTVSLDQCEASFESSYSIGSNQYEFAQDGDPKRNFCFFALNTEPCVAITRTMTLNSSPNGETEIPAILDITGGNQWYCIGPYEGMNDEDVDISLEGDWEFTVTEEDWNSNIAEKVHRFKVRQCL